MPSLLKRSLYFLIGFSLALALTFTQAVPLGWSQTRTAQTERHGAQSLLEQGRSAYQSQQIDEAIALWQSASRQFQQQGDALQQALALSYLSMAYQYQGNWP